MFNSWREVVRMRVGVVGASGYAGAELVRLLAAHPQARLTYLAADTSAGRNLAEVYSHLRGICDLPLEAYSPEQVAASADAVFVALPSGRSGAVATELANRGLRVIDLSGDHRLPGPVYEAWYGKPAPAAPAQPPVYGLPELFPETIAGARLIANPGCYPTAALLALGPAVRCGLVEPRGIVFDGKSGVSGAGRGLSLGTHFGEVNENCRAYKVGAHQHTPEIEAGLTAAAGLGGRAGSEGGAADGAGGRSAEGGLAVTFTAHLVPMTRGILMTAYAMLRPGVAAAAVRAAYEEQYLGRPFVRLLRSGRWPETKAVLGSNYCDVAVHVDERTGRLVAIAAIDNLVKGAAGQALQNLNLLAGWPETAGLTAAPLYP